jgi:hypothetical protein
LQDVLRWTVDCHRERIWSRLRGWDGGRERSVVHGNLRCHRCHRRGKCCFEGANVRTSYGTVSGDGVMAMCGAFGALTRAFRLELRGVLCLDEEFSAIL